MNYRIFLATLSLGLSLLVSGCSDNSNSPEGSKYNQRKWSFQVSKEDLKEVRDKFQTKIVDTSFKPDGTPDIPPKGIFDLITYSAKDGQMAAYLTPNPGDGKKHPAIIWIHGGYGGIGDWFWESAEKSNDQSGRALREAGIVMMVPSFRGENANPGKYEMFYGEINDLEAARQYLASLPYVDPDRIYLMGHSTGGTTVLLGNEYSKGFRAAFSLGGVPDLKLRLEAGRMMVAVPFDQTNPKELDLRSPRTYITSLKSPTFYFEGAENYWQEFNEIEEVAKANNVPFRAFRIDGADHFNIVHPVTQLVAKKILQDTAEKTNIQFTKEDIQWIKSNVSK